MLHLLLDCSVRINQVAWICYFHSEMTLDIADVPMCAAVVVASFWEGSRGLMLLLRMTSRLAWFCFAQNGYAVDGKVRKKNQIKFPTCINDMQQMEQVHDKILCIQVYIYFMHISCKTLIISQLIWLVSLGHFQYRPLHQQHSILPCITCNLTGIEQLELGCGCDGIQLIHNYHYTYRRSIDCLDCTLASLLGFALLP